MIKKIIRAVGNKILKYPPIQNKVNFKYNREGFAPVPIMPNTYYYHNNLLFEINDQIETIKQVNDEYRFSDIKKTDIVLDIGANIGGFTIQASRKAKKVFAVEPIFPDILKKNAELNNIKNIEIIDSALGAGKLSIAFGKRKKTVTCISFSKILDLCGGHVDFLKMDCEGGEWYINSEDLRGIRRIEAEIHNLDHKRDFTVFLKLLDANNFEYETNRLSRELMLIHAKKKAVPA